MYHLRIIYDVDHWGYHHRAMALEKFAPQDFHVSIAQLGLAEHPTVQYEEAVLEEVALQAIGTKPADVLFILPRIITTYARVACHQKKWKSKLVCSWNKGWPDGLSDFRILYDQSDFLIINNKEYSDQTGQLPNTRPINNGVDLSVFKVLKAIETRKPKALWIGAEMSLKRKGYFDFLCPLEKALIAEGFECDFHVIDSVNGDKRTPAEMCEWYNSGTVLVCTSSTEGTPNIALEAAASGCTVVTTSVGNMPELIKQGENGFIIQREFEPLIHYVRKALVEYKRLAVQMQADIQSWNWGKRSEQFFDVFRTCTKSSS